MLFFMSSLLGEFTTVTVKITCPGVLLKDKEELYLSVSVLGQYKKTRCVPAAFPLLFEEKLVFEKAFADIVDPGDLVELLEFDTAILELIQLVPPVGEILATYEENTRDFLFPDPKLTRGHHGLDREILMKRSSSFTGIAPKLRFSTSSLITESLLSSGRSHIQDNLNRVHHSTPNGKLQTRLPKKNTLSPEKNRHSLATKNYEQPTIASKSRSPSPYTKRRMCELSEEARQRLAHLNLGPFEFRRETDKPPFVVRRVEQPSPSVELHTWCPPRESTVETWSKILLFSAATGPRKPKFNSGWPTPANGDEIHKRVKNILRTHSARQRLIFDESNSSKEDLTKTGEFSHKASLSMSELQSSSPVQQNTTVHLDNGEYWSSHAAVYKGKPHRAIFEDSLEKIYRNMYRKASGTVSDQKTHS
ncbi:spermatogenesis-associated protein 6 isoform X3 [Apteryx mantelli]|uniref:Spermatogenesis-associated protein 6 isoform X3 n=1 Tax=Apteryx mantelli TaxID=2696672 RepID=A0A8B7IZU8_9AVES